MGNQPALVAAARAGHASLVRMLIASGADVRSHGAQALAEAVAGGRLAAAKTLLEAGVKLEGSALDLRMASAVAGGSVEIAELVLKQGCNLAKLPPIVIEAATKGGSEAMRKWLRQQGVKVPEETLEERLLSAIRADDLPVVQKFISGNNPPGFFMGNRWEGMAIQPTDLPDVRWLIAQGSIGWSRGARSAGAVAAATGDLKMLLAVSKAGGGMGLRFFVNNGDGLLRRPLWFAAARGDVDMAEWLLANGAEADATTFAGQTALGVATSLGHKAVADVLLKHGAKPVAAAPERTAEKTANSVVGFPKGFKPPAVAMVPVSIVDAWHSSTSAAADLGAALEAGALNLPEVRWIERAEIERLGGEWATEALGGGDPAAALQKGRLARADWMVTTRILPDEGRGRTMVFEVLDTRTAESLALRTVVLPGRLGWPLNFEATSVPALLAEMRSALAAAAHTVEEARGKQRLACLFFANRAPTDRFATLAGDAMEVMSAAAESPDAKLPHVVRFRRSRAAAGEAELAAAGWLDQGENGLQQVADAFAWGSITEAGNGDALRDDVQIKLTWEVWTGGEDTVKHEALCRAGDAAATMRALSKKVLTSLPPKGALTTLKLREAMAQRMMDQAKALGTGSDNSESAEVRQRWRARVALLEAAHFINPESVKVEAAMIVERWHWMHATAIGTVARSVVDFYTDLQRRAAWDRFAKAHGYAALRSVFEDEPMRDRRWPWPRVIGETRMADNGVVMFVSRGKAPKMTLCHAEVLRRVLEPLAQFDQSIPGDLSPQIREQWLASLAVEFAKLMAAAEKTEEGSLNLSLFGSTGTLALIPDVALRYRTAVLILRGSSSSPQQSTLERNRFCSELLSWAEDAGSVAEALIVLREVRADFEKNQPAAVTTNPKKSGTTAGSWQIQREHMSDRLAAEQAKIKGKPGWLNVAPEERELTGYHRSGTVMAMSFHRGKLYLAVNGGRKDGTYTKTVWEHDLEKGSFTLVPGMEFKLPQDEIGLTAHHTGLWLWTTQNGIWHRDWSTGVVTHHESKSGLPTDHIFYASAVGDIVFFGGGRTDDGAVFSWDATARSWRVLPVPERTRSGVNPGTLRMLPMGDELSVRTPHSFAVVDPKTKASRDLSAYLLGNRIFPSESLVTGRTLWSLDERHFTRIDLAAMTHRPVTQSGGGPAVSGTPCFLAESDDCVWAITRDDFSDFARGLNIHRLFAVKKSDATIQAAVLLPMLCRIQCAVVVDRALWLGVARGQSSSQSAEGLPCLIRLPLGR